MLMYLVACQVYNEVLQTQRLFSTVGLQTTITEKRGNLIQRLLSLIYDMFTVKLDKKEEKWWQDDKRKLHWKTLRVISLLISLPLHPSIIPPSCLSFSKSSESQSIPTFTQDERGFCLNSSNMKRKWYVNVVFDSV